MGPSIILVRPQMGENIGAAARAMANFGAQDLRLVAPRDGWPNPRAADMAGRAIDLLDAATVHASAREAVADCQFVLAATARGRAVNIPALATRDAMALLCEKATQGQRCAVLFGPERTGLENEEVALADAVLHIPVAAEYPSLNLAQAVVVVLAEWFQQAGDAPSFTPQANEAATRAQLQGLLDQLESALDAAAFWNVPEKKESMWRNIRAGLMRAQFTPQDIATWRGIIRALARE